MNSRLGIIRNKLGSGVNRLGTNVGGDESTMSQERHLCTLSYDKLGVLGLAVTVLPVSYLCWLCLTL